jgi:hypothetical protein
MAQFVYFCDGAKEAIVIDEEDLTQQQLESKYKRTVEDVIRLPEGFDVETWPVDQILE